MRKSNAKTVIAAVKTLPVFHSDVLKWWLDLMWDMGMWTPSINTIEIWQDHPYADGWRCLLVAYTLGDTNVQFCEIWLPPGFHRFSSDIPF